MKLASPEQLWLLNKHGKIALFDEYGFVTKNGPVTEEKALTALKELKK